MTNTTDPVDTDAQFSDQARQAAAELRGKAERNIALGKHDGRSPRHSAACEGCQILGLMAEVDRLRAVIENAPHPIECKRGNSGNTRVPCTCWKADAL